MASGVAGILGAMFDVQGVTGSSPVSSTRKVPEIDRKRLVSGTFSLPSISSIYHNLWSFGAIWGVDVANMLQIF
jgi:hypothetical protein